jgi:hypothetical protein
MSLLQLSQLADIVGVILVVGSLIYVGIQLKQNTAAQHAQSRHALLEASQTELFWAGENDMLGMITKKSELTREEQSSLNVWFTATLRARMFAWLQFRNRIIDSDQWEEERLVIQIVFSSRRGREWWTAVGRLMFTGSFVELVDEALSDQPVSDEFYELQIGWSKQDSVTAIG